MLQLGTMPVSQPTCSERALGHLGQVDVEGTSLKWRYRWVGRWVPEDQRGGVDIRDARPKLERYVDHARTPVLGTPNECRYNKTEAANAPVRQRSGGDGADMGRPGWTPSRRETSLHWRLSRNCTPLGG